MNYIIFEDSKVFNLKPFSLNHASFEMRCGIYSNVERILIGSANWLNLNCQY